MLTEVLILTAADVWVEGNTDCIDEDAARVRLLRVLADNSTAARRLRQIVARDQVTETATTVTLRGVTAAGEIVLDRKIELMTEDCPSATDLLGLLLESYLTTLPRSRAPPAPKPIVPEKIPLSAYFLVAANSRWFPIGAGVELGSAMQLGAQHQLAASVMVRIAAPHGLEEGHYIESMGLLGVGWGSRAGDWQWQIELRSGALLVAGYGFRTSYRSWLPWVEGHGVLFRQMGPLLLGLQAGLSPLRHTIRTTTGREEGEVPWIRLGIALAIPLFSKAPSPSGE